MNADQELEQILSIWMRRERLQRILRWAGRGMWGGLGMALLAAAIALPRAALTPDDFLRLTVGLVAVGGILLGSSAAARTRSSLESARRFDRLFGLQERVSTALEQHRNENNQTALQEHLLADALEHARQVHPQRALPLRPPDREIIGSAILLSLVLFLCIVPLSPFQAAQQARANRSAIQRQVQAVEALRQQAQRQPGLSAETRQALERSLQQTQHELQTAPNLEAAYAALQAGRSRLQALNPVDLPPRLEASKSAGQALASVPSPLSAAGQALAQGQLEQAASEIARINPAQLDPAQAQVLTRPLQAAARNVQAGDPALAQQLAAAAQALQTGQNDLAQQALQAAAGRLRATAAQQAQLQTLQGLAQALQQGQAQLTQAGGTGTPAAWVLANGTLPISGTPTLLAGPGGMAGAAGQANGTGAGRGEAGSPLPGGAEASDHPLAQNNGPGDGGLRPYESIYAPQRLGGSGTDGLALPGSGQAGQIIGQTGSAPSDPGESSVMPYVNALPVYQQAYRQAVQNGQVPLHLQAIVKQYFSSLQP